jgi:hypothetical protein
MAMLRDGSRRAMPAATIAVKSGTAPFSIPVSADETCCSAKGNMLSGNAIQSTPTSAMPGQSSRPTGRREPGNSASVRKPTRMRVNVTPFGPIASRPSAMKRNDAPQMTPGTMSRIQSISAPECH